MLIFAPKAFWALSAPLFKREGDDRALIFLNARLCAGHTLLESRCECRTDNGRTSVRRVLPQVGTD